MVSLITGAIGLGAAALIVWLVRKDRLHVNHGFGWIVAAACFSLLGFAPGLFDEVAVRLGVAYPPVLGLTLAIVILVIKTLLMDIERARLEMRNQRLTQRMAMLEAEIKQLQRVVQSLARDDSSSGATDGADDFGETECRSGKLAG
ncbi:MAG: DUF2304 domain-containing protein [Pseudomonadota bacterium]